MIIKELEDYLRSYRQFPRLTADRAAANPDKFELLVIPNDENVAGRHFILCDLPTIIEIVTGGSASSPKFYMANMAYNGTGDNNGLTVIPIMNTLGAAVTWDVTTDVNDNRIFLGSITGSLFDNAPLVIAATDPFAQDGSSLLFIKGFNISSSQVKLLAYNSTQVPEDAAFSTFVIIVPPFPFV